MPLASCDQAASDCREIIKYDGPLCQPNTLILYLLSQHRIEKEVIVRMNVSVYR